MSQRRHKRPTCALEHCGSRRFHVGDDGFTYCDQGHQQSDAGLVIAEDTGELTVQGRTSKRKTESDGESGITRVTGFTGTKAFEHYLLCVQLVLRKQLRWLIDVRKLPEELETVVRDLWALRLQKLQHKVSFDADSENEAQSSRMFSSQSEGESRTDAKSHTSRQTQTLRRHPRSPKPIELLALIYIGILMLRIPITVADMHAWINDGHLLYYRAARQIPLAMRDRLPGHFQEQLEPQDVLKPDTLHRKVLDLLTTLDSDFGMAAPPLNDSLVLYRWIRSLSLPLEIYIAVQRLARVLELDYSYSLDAKAWSNIALRCPEIRLMTLVVMSTKLIFSFDGVKRYPKSANDLAALEMDWDVWSNVHSQTGDLDGETVSSNHLSFQDAFTMTESQSLDLADDRLDEYLNWYEGNIASEQVRQRGRAGRDAEFRRTLFKMFPTDDPKQSIATRAQAEISSFGNTSEQLLHVQSALRAKRIAPVEGSDDVPRTGTSYIQYKTEDELSGTTRLFHERAAALAGYSLSGLARAVFVMERRLMKIEKGLRKQRSQEEV